ncbi:hypothetical protein N6H18_12410 [Reichenbachiella agarivorans]|uniref:Uncharacterized protein n=1 Tax=Reichenbachiella agarivorans TaxID=2979464 RepID=A0ABY6CKV5_9BACT|nr:hypothetical protein [Reichenbachiella agarivorans]UXP31151.1 hypothetical protein N6H18_12410 [Reichenbachiella agarivorans]
MFDSSDYPKPLDESLFNSWLENGRLSKISYAYLLIIWDELEGNYLPLLVEHRDRISDYEQYGNSTGRESLVAAYDLYSESRITFV